MQNDKIYQRLGEIKIIRRTKTKYKHVKLADNMNTYYTGTSIVLFLNNSHLLSIVRFIVVVVKISCIKLNRFERGLFQLEQVFEKENKH